MAKRKPVKQPAPAQAPVAVKSKPEWDFDTASMVTDMVRLTGPNDDVPAMPTVFYTPEVDAQMKFIVNKCNQEVGWMGLVTHYEDQNAFLVHRIMLPQQQVHSATTEISDEGLSEIAEELIAEDVDTSTMYCWYHSHVNMAVSPSQQDEDQVAEYMSSCPIFIRGIVNKRGDSKVDVYYRDHNIAYTCVPTAIFYNFDKDPLEGLEELIKERVKPIVTVYPNNWNNHYSTRGSYYPSVPVNQRPNSDAMTPYGNTYVAPVQGTYTQEEIAAENDEVDHLYDTVPDYTGYGFEWDECDPIGLRPMGWADDPMYIQHGKAHDSQNQWAYEPDLYGAADA